MLGGSLLEDSLLGYSGNLLGEEIVTFNRLFITSTDNNSQIF